MRRLGVIASGQDPLETEIDDALVALKGLYQRLITEGTLGSITDVIATPGVFNAPENSRVLRNDPATVTINLPETVTDCGVERPPLSGAVIVIADTFSGVTATHIYDGELRRWLIIETLDRTAVAPLAERDVNGLASLLALELADEYGQEPGPVTTGSALRFQASLAADFSRPVPTVPRPEAYF